MRAFIKNYLASERARREEEGREGGFSLIELIVVVVILGILAAIAIPIFLNLQNDAKNSAAVTVAANGATQAAATIAGGKTAADVSLTNLVSGKATAVTLTKPSGTSTDLSAICVSATVDGVTKTAGPGALADGSGCKP